MGNLVLIVQLTATWYMVGLIWMVQVVHYPMFDRVGKDQFTGYEAEHTRRITPIVGFPMLIEAGTAVVFLLVVWQQAQQRNWAIISLLMLIGIWLITAFYSVPYHTKLAAGFDADAHRWLVLTNWFRTALWTGRGIILAWLTLQVMALSPLDRNLLAE